MKKKLSVMVIFLLLSTGVNLWAINASTILKKVEEYSSGLKAPQDMQALMIMKIQHGEEIRERKLKTWSKNNIHENDYRILKFFSPADVKDIGLLILSEDLMYIYLPEFHRIRRIASSNKNDSFQGSDLSYEDMGFSEYSQYYFPRLLSENDQHWILELTKKPDVHKPYSRIVVTVDKNSFMPLSMDLYSKSEELWKHVEYTIISIPPYNVIDSLKMENKKRRSTTILEFRDIKVDQDLNRDIFSQRFLKRRVE